MGTELANLNNEGPVPAPFGRPATNALASINAGSVSIESERAVAEAQGQLTLAKRFPRDLTSAHAELMMACKSPAFAGVAFYNKPQGGGTVSGPSIRMAEEVARVVGNFQYGHRELSRDDKKSEVEVFAWDMEKNNYNKRQLTVMHVRDTRDGPKKLRDQTDIDQKINNVASKQVRGLILAMMPKWLVEDAVNECKKTLAGTNDEPLEVRVRKMTQAFAKFGVTPDHLEKRLGHKLSEVLLDELVDMMGIFNALKEGTPASEFFGQQEAAEATANTADAIKTAAAKGAAAKPAATKTAADPAPAESKPVQKESKPVKEPAAAEAVAKPQAQPTAEPEAAAPAAGPAADEGDVF